jgi:REP element-mobilizing transposase RayT
MPRRPRIHVPGGFYHVTLRGNHRRDIFFADGDRHLLNRIVARSLTSFHTRLHAYCWMTNHLHLLLQAGSEPIGCPMRNIASEFARAMQRHLRTTGHFFERRYHATLLDHDAYLLQVLRYIHRNPVEAGIAIHVADYPWSSHHAYVGTREERWVTVDFALRMFSEVRSNAVAAYLRFLGQAAEDRWVAEMASNGGNALVLGSDDFIARVTRSDAPARSSQSLASLISEACQRFDLDPARLETPSHDRHVAKVRAWIAHQAKVRRIATLSAVARRLGRNEATLRYAIRRYSADVK